MGKNLHGGNKSKKMKNSHTLEKPDIHEIGVGQMVGRVMKLLGDRQAQVYCNDNVERLCRIRGKLRKRVWINTGDIVLISLRMFTEDLADKEDEDDDDEDSSEIEESVTSSAKKGDILAKYDPDVYSKLKKIAGVNKRLFGALDSVSAPAGHDEDDIFDDADEDECNGPNEENNDSATTTAVKKTPWKRSTAKVGADNDDIDIDAI